MAAGRRSTAGIVVVVVVAVALGVLFGVRSLIGKARESLSSPSCDVKSYQLSTDQAAVAAQMVGAVSRYPVHLPERATVLVLMAALQESKLTNLAPGEGDRDSVGVLQQRPSQGWGGYRAGPLTNPTEATTEFLDHLVQVRGWQAMAPADAVQAVQVSADGSLYAQHEPEARALADAFSGRRAAGVTCSFDAPTLVAPPAKVATLLRAQLPLRAVRPSGRSVQVPAAGSARAGWQTAAWLVAYADRLGIDAVSYHGRRWSRSDGWQRSARAGAAAVVATLATV